MLAESGLTSSYVSDGSLFEADLTNMIGVKCEN